MHGNIGQANYAAGKLGIVGLTKTIAKEWGRFGIRTYFSWKRAYNQVWKSVPHAIMLRRLQKARACGLTYEEYTAFLLDTGRYLQPDDQDIIAQIINQRSAI